MKAISKTLLSLGLVFMLGAAITMGQGDDALFPLVTIHSSGNVARGEIGSFVLQMTPATYPGTYINFSVSGTAVPGVDYDLLATPAYIGPSGYGTILVQTLPDPRGSFLRRQYSLVVTLESGEGYNVGEPGSAKMMIRPSL